MVGCSFCFPRNDLPTHFGVWRMLSTPPDAPMANRKSLRWGAGRRVERGPVHAPVVALQDLAKGEGL